MKILIINGPNLNMLGKREVGVYGHATLHEIEVLVKGKAVELGVDVAFFQSNHEGQIIDEIHSTLEGGADGIVINPGGYTHTSVAIRDALLSVDTPFVEVHISNIANREDFRQKSLFSDMAVGTISGFGPLGYVFGLEALWGLYGKKAE
ncbi:MAG: type II 3-dehydroquinate dehydratase [Thermodesulfobacteriota bacterium]|nr:type II 3-dehydroquinate dehydratase [Thermodesulfobacteriota bacterium]